MTFKFKPIPINQLGWLYVNLDKEVMDFLWKMIDKSTKDNMKSNLAGNISKSYSLKDDKNYEYDIEVDGGINFSNSKDVINAGANILVSGTTIFKSNNGDIKKNIDLLKSQ